MSDIEHKKGDRAAVGSQEEDLEMMWRYVFPIIRGEGFNTLEGIGGTERVVLGDWDGPFHAEFYGHQLSKPGPF